MVSYIGTWQDQYAAELSSPASPVAPPVVLALGVPHISHAEAPSRLWKVHA